MNFVENDHWSNPECITFWENSNSIKLNRRYQVQKKGRSDQRLLPLIIHFDLPHCWRWGRLQSKEYANQSTP